MAPGRAPKVTAETHEKKGFSVNEPRLIRLDISGVNENVN